MNIRRLHYQSAVSVVAVALLFAVASPVLAARQSSHDVATGADAATEKESESTLPIPQSHDDQPMAEEDEQQPNASLTGPRGTESADDDRREYDEDTAVIPPNIDFVRVTALSIWIASNAVLAVGYTGAGFFVQGPLAIIWGAFGGTFLLAPLGALIGATIGAAVGFALWTASTEASDVDAPENPMELILRQIDRLLRGAQAATLGMLMTAGAGAIGGLSFALLGGVAGGLLAEQPGPLRQITYVAAGVSLVATSAAVGVGAYFGHLQLDSLAEFE